MTSPLTTSITRYALAFTFAFAALLPARNTWAARPFITDDARLTTAGSCQLESWMRSYPDNRQVWALPACNPGGNLEFTVGGGRSKDTGVEATVDQVFQLKTLFRPMQTNDWGGGVAIGVVRHPSTTPGPNALGNTYAYLPLSRSLLDDQLILHGNAGWSKDRASGLNGMTWGAGGEYKIGTRFLAIAESFGDNHTSPYWQVGGRFSIIPDTLQVDMTVGKQFSGPDSGRWMSFGLRFTPAKLF